VALDLQVEPIHQHPGLAGLDEIGLQSAGCVFDRKVRPLRRHLGHQPRDVALEVGGVTFDAFEAAVECAGLLVLGVQLSVHAQHCRHPFDGWVLAQAQGLCSFCPLLSPLLEIGLGPDHCLLTTSLVAPALVEAAAQLRADLTQVLGLLQKTLRLSR